MPAFIAMSNPDDTYTGIFVIDAFDPHLLVGSYATRAKTRKLVKLGDLLTIGGKPEDCVAFNRDRGEALDKRAERRGSIEELLGIAQTRGCTVFYAMKPDNLWHHQPVEPQNKLVQIVLA